MMGQKKKDKIIAVYCIENIVNGKKYIGKAKDLKKRWHHHKYELRHNKHINEHLQNAWNFYSEENFKFYIIEICSLENLLEREEYYTKIYKTTDPNFGYNSCLGGGGMTDPTPETREKLSKARKGKKFSEEHKQNISKGRTGLKRAERTEKERLSSSKSRQGKTKGIPGNGVKTSKYIGVSYDKRANRWYVKLSYLGKGIFGGSFTTEIEAALAYNQLMEELWGYKAILNQIPDSELASLWSDCYDPTNSLP